MHQALERLAQPLVARPTGDSLERRVERRDGAVGSQREDHIAHPFDERAVLLFAVAPRVLGAGVLRARPREIECAGDGRRQALEVVLNDVVGGAGLGYSTAVSSSRLPVTMMTGASERASWAM